MLVLFFFYTRFVLPFPTAIATVLLGGDLLATLKAQGRCWRCSFKTSSSASLARVTAGGIEAAVATARGKGEMDESLESRINRATNPLNKDVDWEGVQAFCEQLNQELEGPQLATRLLAHKIQSPQEWEAVQGLMYLGTRSPEKVKLKIIELMYSWTLGLPDELKIAEAYQMLKKQGIVKEDPKIPEEARLPPPPPRPKNAIFDDEEKSKMLARLLKSSHPEDLRAANKLIKEMVQEDQKRLEKISKRVNAIEEVNNNVKLLTDMLNSYTQGETSEGNEDLMKELYQRCEKLRPTLFRLASDTEDNDEALAEILQANDNLTQVINKYRQLVTGEEMNGETPAGSIPGSSSALLDLSGLDMPTTGLSYPAQPSSVNHSLPQEQGRSTYLLDDELMSLGLNDPAPSVQALDSNSWNSYQSSVTADLPVKVGPAMPSAGVLKTEPKQLESSPDATTILSTSRAPAGSGLEDLDLLGKTLLQQSLPPESQQVRWEKQQPRLTLRDLQSKTVSSNTQPGISHSSSLTSSSLEQPVSPLTHSLSMGTASVSKMESGGQSGIALPTMDLGAVSDSQQELSLANITVPLESIKPSSILPVTVYDQNSFRVLFHFAHDSPPGRPDVLVVVISMISTAPQPVKNIIFQSAVPKVMKVKLQPPSGTELPAFNPIVPPTAITQVLLLANPQKEKVRLRYKLTFTMGGQTYDEIGDVDQFPPADSWGHL
ncbi:ADP-ribosylation factor-binding protein GGA1 isoform X2 [Microcaecilia unicolor]|uniref:ADP-ribosylation factor-binding protein GGA1 isoform X2 n=1 Tax=Microcaecilia unicolor TaxID=1415580 RepID=A0A6P7YKW2_9AMPH|nr:ADP-ribosylation factor-binding protein GGA1 isoform X2 [Microcaecilia unicolor]